MDNKWLRDRLAETIEDNSEGVPVESEKSADNISSAAESVMSSYQNANKWLDIIKEYVLMDLGCVFLSNYIHNLAHSMPVRFDKFGDILHTVDMKVPYPATEYIPTMPSDVSDVFTQVFDILDSISESLRGFIKITQDTENHALACSAEELLVDISGEYVNLHRMRRGYTTLSDSSALKFDMWLSNYLNNLGSFID